jgi:DNA-binding beta-propeller fold protein YncE
MHRSSVLAAALSLALACKESPGPAQEAAPDAPAVDLSGAWAGTWSGRDNVHAMDITGFWEADIVQSTESVSVTGTAFLSGDIDCPFSTIWGYVAYQTMTGSISRPPCQSNSWTMSALNLLTRSTSGWWSQSGTGSNGTFTGRQIAKPGGPRIAYASPPAAPPGALVTLAGERFGASASADLVDLDGVFVGTVLRADDHAILLRVPPGATLGSFAVTTSGGTAVAPRPFDPGASHPGAVASGSIAVGGGASGVAFLPDSRRAYVANRSDGTVSLLDPRLGMVLATVPVDPAATLPVEAVAAHPDGRRVFVAAGSVVKVIDPQIAAPTGMIDVPAGGTGNARQGLAVTPDGRILYAAESTDGGAVRAVDLETQEIVATVSLGAGSAPLAVAVSPDGVRAYAAFSGWGPALHALHFAGGPADVVAFAGNGASGVAVTPDGAKVYVPCAGDGTVAVFDAEAGVSALPSIPVGGTPAAIAMAPDGARALVAKGEGAVAFIDTASDLVTSTVTTGGTLAAIAVVPDGTMAYAVDPAAGAVWQIGGPRTLSVSKAGSGMGRIVSTPAGIDCGARCQARFPYQTWVTLTAFPDSNSQFQGWSGDCPAGGGSATVQMSASRSCTATFAWNSSGGGGGSEPVNGVYPGCFIATAAYGSPMAEEVQALREFRDLHLLTNGPGRALVAAYYRLSPPLAAWLRQHDGARAAVRWALGPVVFGVRNPGTSAALAASLAAGIGLALARRRARRDEEVSP